MTCPDYLRRLSDAMGIVSRAPMIVALVSSKTYRTERKFSIPPKISLTYHIRYQCPICVSMIHAVDNPDSLWHCRKCHNVVHFRCIEDWANTSGTITLRGTTWKCPYCQADQNRAPRATCWCGKESFARNATIGRTAIPNACQNECSQRGKCTHNTDSVCMKNCHPGPCQFPCSDICTNPPLGPPSPPNILARFSQRFEARKKGDLSGIFALTFIIGVVYAAWAAFFFEYHLKRFTESYNYPEWFYSNSYEWEGGLGTICIIGLTCLMAFVILTFFQNVGTFLNYIMALDAPPRSCLKGATRFFGTIILFFICLGTWILPLIG
jgi:hypothetical protein